MRSAVASTCPSLARAAEPVAAPSEPERPSPPSANIPTPENRRLSPVRLPPGSRNDGPVTAAFQTSLVWPGSACLPPSKMTESPTTSPLS
ncbi:hypothetical protein [Nonomuraea jabiensis]|uniref:hypothetical protein n=1 Tax=Nonomuraea jabiensis TaxID=882448 RepID=UPI003D743AE1